MTALPFVITHANYAFRDGPKNAGFVKNGAYHLILACFMRVQIMAKKKMSRSRKKM